MGSVEGSPPRAWHPSGFVNPEQLEMPMNASPGFLPVRRSALALTALLIGTAALAGSPEGAPRWHDGPRHGPLGAEQHLARLDEALDLSDAQSAELLALLQSADAERQALHERIMSEYRPEICALMQETDSGILAVLTPEQAETFGELKANRRDRSGGRWGHGMGDFDCGSADD